LHHPQGERVRLRALIFAHLCLMASLVLAEEPDWSLYAQVLAAHVTPGQVQGVALNVVDYSQLAQDPRFKRVVQQLANFSIAKLSTPDERLAFHINAYNILALNMVVAHWPLTSIKDVGNLFRPVWKRPAGILAGKTVSLDDIEHQQLRKLGVPGMHLAIVCASVSCPDLRAEPYRAARLAQQLADQATKFLENPAKGCRIEGQHVQVSKIFDWFEEDFSAVGGVEKFLRQYRELPSDARVTADLPYHWEVNARP
jgi:Protein of unknown function, DUF547